MISTQSKHLSIDQIKMIEPRVNAILAEAAHTKRARWSDYSRFKLQLIPLVGFYSENKMLRTSYAYDTTIFALCRALKI
jgi:hypothetical protein